MSGVVQAWTVVIWRLPRCLFAQMASDDRSRYRWSRTTGDRPIVAVEI